MDIFLVPQHVNVTVSDSLHPVKTDGEGRSQRNSCWHSGPLLDKLDHESEKKRAAAADALLQSFRLSAEAMRKFLLLVLLFHAVMSFVEHAWTESKAARVRVSGGHTGVQPCKCLKRKTVYTTHIDRLQESNLRIESLACALSTWGRKDLKYDLGVLAVVSFRLKFVKP